MSDLALSNEIWKPKCSPVITDRWRIIEETYEEVFYYDCPILFVGVNNDGENIVGTFIKANETLYAEFHVVTSVDVYKQFISKEISYPRVMELANTIYVLHWTGSDTPCVYEISFSDIPIPYLPHEKAMFPN